MANDNLRAAKVAKNDEFYTQYNDIQMEVNAYLEFDPDVFRGKTVLLPCDDPEWSNFTRFFAQNFEAFGLKKLISTSFAPESKNYRTDWQPTLFEQTNPLFDADKTKVCGKIFVLDRDVKIRANERKAKLACALPNAAESVIIDNGDQRINIEDLEWQYLKGTGDFRSEEVTALRDEADIIVTNPPFSLFREFMAWLVEGGKQFLIIGNMNAISYKEVFPLIKENKMWYGPSISSGDREFGVPDFYPLEAAGWRIDDEGKKYIRVKGVRWFTNLDHGRRHQHLSLLTEEQNIKFSRHKEVKGKGYSRYLNYDGIDVPYTDAIPSDYEGMMGVPVSFLDKYCPEQFEILGMTDRDSPFKTKNYTKEDTPKWSDLNRRGAIMVDGELQSTYARILIRKIK